MKQEESRIPERDSDKVANSRREFLEFIRLKNEVSELMACEVDLTTPNALHKVMKDEILKEAIRAA